MNAARGTFTRRLDAMLYELQSEFVSLCDIRDFNAKIRALVRAGKSDRASKLKQLLLLFDACGIPYELGQDNDYYIDAVKKYREKIPRSIEDRIVYALYDRYRDYPSPEDYMKRLVDRLCDPKDGWSSDTLRLRILKQFIKYGGCLTYRRPVITDGKSKTEKVTIYGGEAYLKKYLQKKPGGGAGDVAASISLIEDDVFDVLADATKAQKKPAGPYGLLKIADDLAGGRFRVGGGTKKSLYLFAMVYGMTFSSDDASADPMRDIEINLFRDYYTNNLMRFISDAYRGKLCEYELDPSGQGINYKNFAEMVYLYYIAKPCSPEEKIRSSDEMIGEIQKAAYSKGSAAPERARETAYFRGLFKGGKDLFSEDVLSLSESDFKEFLLKNYDCDTANGAYSVSEMQLEAEQKTAFRIYNALIERLIEEKRWAEAPDEDHVDFAELSAAQKQKERDHWLSQCNYGLWFMDAAAFKKKTYQSICDRRGDIDREKFTEFMELLFGVNSFMGHTVSEEVSRQSAAEEWDEVSSAKTKALFVSSADDVTRTSIIVAFYYYYNALHEDDGDEKWKSFKEVFSDFKKELDGLLEAAYYQPLSAKNLFDVLVVFSSYAYLNL